MVTFICPHCGSPNVKVLTPGNPFLANMMRLLLLFSPPQRLRGTVLLECRDCGHQALLHVD